MIKKKHLHLCISAHLFAKFNQDLAKQGPMLSWVNMFSPLVVVYTANNAEQKLSLRTVFCVAIRHNEYFPQIISSCVVYRCPSMCWLLSKDIVPQLLASVGNISLFFKSNVWNASFYNRKRLCGVEASQQQTAFYTWCSDNVSIVIYRTMVVDIGCRLSLDGIYRDHRGLLLLEDSWHAAETEQLLSWLFNEVTCLPKGKQISPGLWNERDLLFIFRTQSDCWPIVFYHINVSNELQRRVNWLSAWKGP